MWLYSRKQDLNSCRTHRVFKLSAIRLQSPVISNTEGSREALNRKTWLAGGKRKCLFKATETTFPFLPKQRLFFPATICLLTQGTIFLIKVKKLMCLKNKNCPPPCVSFLQREWGLGGGGGVFVGYGMLGRDM